MCQKNHGAAFAPYLRVEKKDFAIVRGEEFVASYQSSQGITRTFCHRCGSNLQWIRASSNALGIAAGTLDSGTCTPYIADCHFSKVPGPDIHDRRP